MPEIDYNKMKADLLDKLSQNFAPADVPEYVPPTAVDPAIAMRAMDDSAKVDMVHGALGAAPLTAYSAKLGQRAGQVGPSPLADAVKEQAMHPLQMEQQRVANQNALAAGSNKYALASAGLGVKQQLGEMAMNRGLLSSFIQATGRQGAAETGADARRYGADKGATAKVEAARVTATAPKTGINPVTGKPYNVHATVGGAGAQADGATADGGASATGDVATRAAAGDYPDLASWAQKAPQEDPNDKRMPKMLKEFRDSLSANKARAGEMGNNQKRMNAAGRIEALGRDPATGRAADLNPQQMTELSKNLDQMLSAGGQTSESVTRDLTPYTKGRSIAQFMQYLTDNPHSTGQQGFVQQVLDTAKRENGVAHDQLQAAQRELLGTHTPLMELFPRHAAAALQAFGFDPSTVDPHTGGLPKGKSPPAGKVDPAALEQRARARLGIDPADKWATDVLNALGKK